MQLASDDSPSDALDSGVLDLDAYERSGPPHAVFRRLRAEAPISRQRLADGREFWAITKHKDIFAVGIDSKTFSSAARGVTMRPTTPEELEAQKGLLINLDPPQHTKYRRLVSLLFSAKHLRRLDAHVRDIASELIDDVVARGECDFVADIAAELPLRVICELIGVPQEDRGKILEWSNRMIAFDDPEYQQGNPLEAAMAAAELFMYANVLAEERQRAPTDDIISRLLQAEVDGERLSLIDFNSFFLLLAAAGNETTRNLVSGAMLALHEHPEQYARLVAQRETLLPSAVEEFLRWVTPVNYFSRTVTRDTELSGVRMREGDAVCLFYASANRDEDVFANVDAFDLARTPNEHLAFGIGTHFCLGANLARLEINIMFDELARRLPDITLTGPAERLRSNFINGVKRLPVRFTPAR